ncbi:MAG: carboxypeptidase regulatory-like domain-containing protein [Ignavibacteria bacterium]|nr:carboxypeptidase regulatory-like domain-containing protein [Ignavibacteria bacterium]
MHYRKISARVIFIFISIVLFQSCSDDITSPAESFVGGIVTDTSGKLLPGVKVKIGDKTTHTDDHGFYKLSGIQLPYDIVIIDDPTKSQLLIKSVNVPYIKIPDFFSYNNTDASADLSITLPAELIQSGKKGKLIFTDGCDKTFSKEIAGQNTSLQVRIREDKFIYGKMIVLIYKTDSEGNILSYENYFESSDLLIVPDQLIHFYLDSQQLGFNPEERTVSGMINIPAGYTSAEQYFFLTLHRVHL